MLKEFLLVDASRMIVGGVEGEAKLEQSLVGMKEAELECWVFEVWHAVYALLVELSVPVGFLRDEFAALSVALGFCSVVMHWLSR